MDRILVVDDEPDVELLFKQHFRKEIKDNTLQFSFVNSADDAIAYCNDHIDITTYIWSDINMPGKSGLQLVEAIREKYPNRPPSIWMISAYADESNFKEALRIGADDFITKPVDFSLLKDKLQA